MDFEKVSCRMSNLRNTLCHVVYFYPPFFYCRLCMAIKRLTYLEFWLFLTTAPVVPEIVDAIVEAVGGGAFGVDGQV